MALTQKTFSMDHFVAKFERCIDASRKRDEELGLDPDTIYDGSTPEELIYHCHTFQKDLRCGLLMDSDYAHYVDVMTDVYEIGGTTALVLAAIVFRPGDIFSLNWSRSVFKELWKRIWSEIPREVNDEASDYSDSTDLVILLLAAQEQAHPSAKPSLLEVPKQPRMSRRKSVSDRAKEQIRRIRMKRSRS